MSLTNKREVELVSCSVNLTPVFASTESYSWHGIAATAALWLERAVKFDAFNMLGPHGKRIRSGRPMHVNPEMSAYRWLALPA